MTIMYMSQSKLPHIRDYWYSPLYESSLIKRLFFYHRFRSILSSLHVEKVNPLHHQANLNKTKSDPVWRLRWMFEFFNHTWGMLYSPGVFLSLDEAMIPSKIRHFLRQYIKGKPHKWGFKLYILACPKSGLALKVVFHEKSSDMKTIVSTVMDQRFHKKGRVLVVDNFYVTLKVAKWALENQLHLLGTMQAARVPIQNWVLPSSSPRGTIKAIQLWESPTQPLGTFFFFLFFSLFFLSFFIHF